MKRYDPEYNGYSAYMDEYEQGDYVKYEDALELQKQVEELLDWQEKVFEIHPNIDVDIENIVGGK